MEGRNGILVVDDTLDTLKVLVATLVEEGFQVRPAMGGEQALTAIRSQPPEMILLDIRMPDIDGFEVCRRLREDESFRTIPVLFLSSSAETEERVKGFELGAVDFVPKPFQREELLARVRAHLELSRLRGRLEAQVMERTEHLRQANEQVELELAERKVVEKALRVSEEKYRRIVEHAPIAIFQRSVDGVYDYINPGLVQMFECSSEMDFLRKYGDISRHWKDPSAFEEHRRLLLENGKVFGHEVEVSLQDGRSKWFSIHSFLDRDHERVNGFAIDITDLKSAERERERLQTQLQKIAKLESIGQLAGGVAHDFNNLLTVILCHTDIGKTLAPPKSPAHRSFQEIHCAAIRSADLTRQLLTFARSQTISPVVLDLNRTIGDLLKMLRRIIGERIELAWKPNPELWNVKVDPTQIDQILANLCINARDAITDSGTIAIDTACVEIGPDDRQRDSEFRPGEYVRISVRDTGTGMAPDVLEKIFEPFFTTKEVGKGTGLGLATVFGAVRQNGGFLHVESEPGTGSTFEVYLPRTSESPRRLESRPGAVREAGRPRETILLVEDSPSVMSVAKLALESSDYEVLTASTPSEALGVCVEHRGPLHLVLSDVVMPEMNGRELVKRLREMRPDLRSLFMSGYSSEIISHYGVLNEDIRFLQKPFTVDGLLEKVAEVLR